MALSSRRPPLAPAYAAILVAALAGCEHTTSTGTAVGGQAAPLPSAPTAEVFAPGVISDSREQWRITFTPDGTTAYFATSDAFFPASRMSTIYVSHRQQGSWTEPEIASFSGEYGDIDPFITPDGRRLYFSSIRPIGGVMNGDVDVWVVEQSDGGWGEPVHLGPEVNRPDADELYPSVDGQGTLYVASGPLFPQPGAHFDIYRAERDGDGFAEREPLGAGVNTAPVAGGGLQDAWEFNPEVSVDGKTLVFTSLRPGGYGLGDLYVSHFEGGAWRAARNLGPAVNTASDEYHPTLSRDRRTLYFVRRLPNPGDLYRIETHELGL